MDGLKKIKIYTLEYIYFKGKLIDNYKDQDITIALNDGGCVVKRASEILEFDNSLLFYAYPFDVKAYETTLDGRTVYLVESDEPYSFNLIEKEDLQYWKYFLSAEEVKDYFMKGDSKRFWSDDLTEKFCGED